MLGKLFYVTVVLQKIGMPSPHTFSKCDSLDRNSQNNSIIYTRSKERKKDDG